MLPMKSCQVDFRLSGKRKKKTERESKICALFIARIYSGFFAKSQEGYQQQVSKQDKSLYLGCLGVSRIDYKGIGK